MDSSNSSRMNQTDADGNLRNSMEVISEIFVYLTLILGVPGNAFVVYVAGLKMKRTVNTIWFLNLAIADLLCCLCIFFYVTENAFGEHWLNISVFLFRILPFIMHTSMFASVFTLSLISLDRFTQVITPVWAQNHRSLFIARLFCAATWILALALGVPFMVLHENSERNNETYTYEMYRKLGIIRFVIGFLVPLICISTCYGFIAHKLRRSHFHTGRAFHIMTAVIMAFFLCWLPFYIMDFIVLYGEESSLFVASAVFQLAQSLAFFNSCLNPILYVFMGRDFKSNVKLSLRRVFERVFSEEGTQVPQSTQSQQMSSM